MSIGSNIKTARKGRYTQADLAEKMGVSQGTIARWETGETEPKYEQVERLAKLLETTPGELAFGTGAVSPIPDSHIQNLEVLGTVEAGSWREALLQDSPILEIAFHPHPSFPAGDQVGFLVRGESCNLVAKDGDILVGVPYERVPGGVEALLEKKTPPLVIAQRDRAGFIEATVKELRVVGDEPQLWPRSDHPAHQDKILLNENGDTDEVRITHVIVQAINQLL